MTDANEHMKDSLEEGPDASEEAATSPESDHTTDSTAVQAQEVPEPEGRGENPDDPANTPESKEKNDETDPAVTPRLAKIQEHVQQIDRYLIWKEDLMLKKVFEKLHLSYYERWSNEANRSIRLLANLKKRAKHPRAG